MLRGTTIALNLQFTKNHRFTFSGKSLNMFFSNHVRGFRLRIRTDCICFFHLFNKNIFQEQHPSGKSYFVGGGIEKPTENQWKTNVHPSESEWTTWRPCLGTGASTKRGSAAPSTCWMVFSTKKVRFLGSQVAWELFGWFIMMSFPCVGFQKWGDLQ
jgi:hypothetical protein